MIKAVIIPKSVSPAFLSGLNLKANKEICEATDRCKTFEAVMGMPDLKTVFLPTMSIPMPFVTTHQHHSSMSRPIKTTLVGVRT